jgi:hypothetical protein
MRGYASSVVCQDEGIDGGSEDVPYARMRINYAARRRASSLVNQLLIRFQLANVNRHVSNAVFQYNAFVSGTSIVVVDALYKPSINSTCRRNACTASSSARRGVA